MEVVVALSLHLSGGTREARRNFSQFSWFSSWGTSHMQVTHFTDWANLLLFIMMIIFI